MTLRRKLAASTIAASVAMTALAGIPLSSKGLAEKLGVSGIAYATAYDDYVAKAQKVYSKLTPTDITRINDFRKDLATALQDPTILEPVINKISNGKPGFKTLLNNLVTEAITTPLSSTWKADLDSLINKYNDDLKAYVTQEYNLQLTVDDIVQVALALEPKLAAIAASVTSEEFLTKDLAEQVRLAIRQSVDANANVKAIVDRNDIKTAEFQAIYTKLLASNVTKARAFLAFDALNRAYKAANETTNPPIGGGDNGTTDSQPKVPEGAAQAAADVGKYKDKIANASPAEKAALIAEAVKLAQDAVNKLSVIENTVTVVNGKATLKLDETKTLSALLGIAAVADALKAAAPGTALPPIKVSIDLGTVTQNDIQVGLSKAIIQQALKSGLAAIVLKSGALAVELPVGGTFSGEVDFSINKSAATEEQTGGKPAASQVYDFNLSIDGAKTTTFDKPVKVQIPVETGNVDAELLSIAKIVNGKLEYYGGRVTDGALVEARDTFSSYVVVENKLTFKDLSRVQAWAGRAIEVVAAKGAIVGKAEGVFAPDDKVTRAEFARMLLRALDLDNSSAKGGFADVKAGDWFAPYVAAAVDQGIIFGRSASQFDPNATITRAEMAAMIARAVKAVHGTADVENVEAALAGFSDAGQISPSLKKSVAFVASNKLVVGSNGKFAPNSNATRAEAAVIIYKAFKFQ